jgi:hypothetical protein
VIDGYKRIAALQQLGRDTVEATVWAMSEAEALLLDRSLRFSPQESALEQGWLLSEMERRFGYSLEELARRFDRSVSWVSRRLALVELLPEAIQQQVREGALRAELAMKYLVPVARVNLEHCERMAAAFVQHRCDTRQAGQLYAAWREGSRVVRERILAEPELFLKTQRQPPVASSTAVGLDRELDRMAARIGKEQEANHAEPGATNRDSGTERAGSEQARDRAPAATVAPDRAQSSALELHPRAGNPTGGESRTVPATDPRAFDFLQGESRASP